jgi:hypothetical protein
MITIKCAWCGTVMEIRDDKTTEVEETAYSLCSVCQINVQTEQTDFIIPIEDT